ncbi:chorismate mutase [Sulfurimonas sp. HSL3-7]|uniref:chorismate mutase n=1 Tax=Sulfonitrofixus jiaomeiensis TaxID=3131938 RepID=UPI0031F7A51E
MELKTCHTLQEVRTEIDKLDDQIVELIGARNSYIKQAAKFKNTVEEVKDPKRIDEVMTKIRHKALTLGMSPNLLEEIYTIMINEMVESEISEFRNANVF